MSTTVYIVFAAAGIIILFSMISTKKIIASVFLTALQGFIALIAANIAGGFFGMHISVNIFSLLLSAFGGTPGVIFMLLADTIFKLL